MRMLFWPALILSCLLLSAPALAMSLDAFAQKAADPALSQDALFILCNDAIEKYIGDNKAYASFVLATRGNIYKERGDLKRALADGTLAIRNNPGNPSGYLVRGSALILQDNLERAAADIRMGALLTRDRETKDSYLQTVQQIEQRIKGRDAKELLMLFEHALTGNVAPTIMLDVCAYLQDSYPDDKEYQATVHMVWAAMLLRTDAPDKFAQALPHVETALALPSSNATQLYLHLMHGTILEEQKKFTAAAAALDKAASYTEKAEEKKEYTAKAQELRTRK